MASEITTREQAEAVARWMGWKPTGSYSQPWRNPKGRMVYRVPPYADSLDAMREVEDEIKRRGLWERYVTTLWMEHGPGGFMERNVYVGFGLRATAAQRLQAAFEVIKEVEDD